VILEIHSQAELAFAGEYINIIGVNNRDLKTFIINTDISLELAEKIQGTFLKISESGISSPSMVKNLRQAGYHGFLIGETFMSGNDPVAVFSDFVKKIKDDNAKS